MLSIPTDTLSNYILPKENDLDLFHLSLVCKPLHTHCTTEARKRALNGYDKIRAYLHLDREMDIFLNRGTSEEEKMILVTPLSSCVNKINSLLKSCENLPFKFLNFQFTWVEEITTVTKLALTVLEQRQIKDFFYSQFYCEKGIEHHAIKLLKKCETSILLNTEKKTNESVNSKIPIRIDASQPWSTGNTFNFIMTQHLFSKKYITHDWGYNKSIILSNSSLQNRDSILTSELEEYKIKMSWLTDLNFLEIKVISGDYVTKTRSCFLSLLEGTHHLAYLLGVYFHFYHFLSKTHIEDLYYYMENHIAIKNSISLIRILCYGLNLEQLQTFIAHLEKYTQKNIEVIIEVPVSELHHLVNCHFNPQKVTLRLVEIPALRLLEI